MDDDNKKMFGVIKTNFLILKSILLTLLGALFPVHTQRCLDVYIKEASITLGRRRFNIKTTLCAYWFKCR